MINSTQNYDWFLFGTTSSKRDVVAETFGKYAGPDLIGALLEEHAAEQKREADCLKARRISKKSNKKRKGKPHP